MRHLLGTTNLRIRADLVELSRCKEVDVLCLDRFDFHTLLYRSSLPTLCDDIVIIQIFITLFIIRQIADILTRRAKVPGRMPALLDCIFLLHFFKCFVRCHTIIISEFLTLRQTAFWLLLLRRV